MKYLLILLAMLLGTSVWALEQDRIDYTSWQNMPEHSHVMDGHADYSRGADSSSYSGVQRQSGDTTQKVIDAIDYTSNGQMPESPLEQDQLKQPIKSASEHDEALAKMIVDGHLVWDPSTRSFVYPRIEK